MIISNVRFSYANVWEAKPNPSGALKFSASIMIPKADEKSLKAVENAINVAIKSGLEKNKFTKAQVNSLRTPVRDGDKEFAAGDRSAEYKGFWFINASSDNPVGIAGPDAKPMFDQEGFYSGCWGHVDVNFFPYNTSGNRGVGAGLNNVMKTKDDERLDGRQSAEQAFDGMGVTPDETESSGGDGFE